MPIDLGRTPGCLIIFVSHNCDDVVDKVEEAAGCSAPGTGICGCPGGTSLFVTCDIWMLGTLEQCLMPTI